MKRSFWGFAMLAVVCVFFSGCVAGQSVTLNYTPSGTSQIGNSQSLKVSVLDQRPYVLSGKKQPCFIGKFRGGYGNTWDVTTTGKVAFAQQLSNDLISDLKAMGFDPLLEGSGKCLKVEIIEYNFDSWINVNVWYNFKVSVLDAGGNILATSELKDEKVIKGSAFAGPAKATKKEMPQIYAEIVQKLARDNQAILDALTK